MFRVYEGNTSSFVQTSGVRSVRDAYRLVTDADIYVYDRYTLLQHNLEQYIQPNLVYDESRSEADLTSQLNEISHYRGMVVEGQKIIDQGEIVDEQKSNIINSYLNIVNEKNQSKRFEMLTWAGRGLFVLLCFLVLFIYLSLYRIDDIENRSILWFLFGSISLFTVSMEHIPVPLLNAGHHAAHIPGFQDGLYRIYGVRALHVAHSLHAI